MSSLQFGNSSVSAFIKRSDDEIEKAFNRIEGDPSRKQSSTLKMTAFYMEVLTAYNAIFARFAHVRYKGKTLKVHSMYEHKKRGVVCAKVATVEGKKLNQSVSVVLKRCTIRRDYMLQILDEVAKVKESLDVATECGIKYGGKAFPVLCRDFWNDTAPMVIRIRYQETSGKMVTSQMHYPIGRINQVLTAIHNLSK